MKIYIVRHGQILSNLIERHTINDEDLTLVGISQAKDLSKKIGKLDFDIVISSPFIRAIHTANIINTKNKKLIIDDITISKSNLPIFILWLIEMNTGIILLLYNMVLVKI